MPTSTSLIEPEGLSPPDVARTALLGAGLPAVDAAWIVEALGTAPATSPEPEPLIIILSRVLAAMGGPMDSTALRLVKFTARIASDELVPASHSRAAVRALLAAAQRQGIDLAATLRHIAALGNSAETRSAAKALCDLGALTPSACVSTASLVAASQNRGAFPKSWGSERNREADADPTRLIFWLRAELGPALTAAARAVEHAPPDQRAFIAKGALWEIGCWSRSTGVHPESYSSMPAELRPAVEPIFRSLLALMEGDPAGAAPPALEALFRAAWIAFADREHLLAPSERDFLTSTAKHELARLRAALSGLSRDDAARFIEDHVDHVRALAHALFSLGSLWDGLKPLLLMVRASSAPIFAHDLSWWTTAAPMANNGVASLAQHFMYFFIAYARYEQNADAQLVELRERFAEFCLDRLKTNKRGDGPNEPNPLWRVAMIRAALELGVNPGRRGHRVLHHAMSNDPDADVRAAAEKAYQRILHQRALPADTSARKAVMHALWWVRQAQLLALGVPVDAQGAQRTRSEEIRYTKLKKHLPGEGFDEEGGDDDS